MKTKAKNHKNWRAALSWQRLEFAVLLIFIFAFSIFFFFDSRWRANAETPKNFAVETEDFNIAPVENLEESADFSNFKHSNPMHERLPCLLCHKRDDNSPAMKFSGHLPCTGCHTQQFNEGNQNPICTICHTADGLKRFPTLQSFTARFDHAKHLQQANCATCHKPTRRGVGFSIPQRSNSHQTCFQCHSATASNEMSSCNACHQPGSPPPASTENVKAYTSTPFRHAEHLRSMNCASCHTVKTGLARGRQVSSPLARMHFAPAGSQSCASCHNNKRTFGGEDFNDCRRCHQGNRFRPFT